MRFGNNPLVCCAKVICIEPGGERDTAPRYIKVTNIHIVCGSVEIRSSIGIVGKRTGRT